MSIFKKVLKAKARTDIETELRELIEDECESIALYGLNDAKLNILAMYIELHRLNSGLNSLESIIDSLKESGADLDSIISQLHDDKEVVKDVELYPADGFNSALSQAIHDMREVSQENASHNE